LLNENQQESLMAFVQRFIRGKNGTKGYLLQMCERDSLEKVFTGAGNFGCCI